MQAAVVESFDRPPRYRDFDEPVALDGELMVSVRAAAKSQLVQAQASGKHYSSGKPPFVPGVDGIGHAADGQRVYFAFPRSPMGAMAECVAVPVAHVVTVPDGIDDVTAAAIANPGMSSWAGLIERAHFQRGESVLINGASGASGQLAIQIARYLGAKRIVATGRNPQMEAQLRSLGADAFVPLLQSPSELSDQFRQEIAGGIDVVLDYLWGPSAEALLSAASGHGKGTVARRIRYVNIGSMGGATIAMPAAALRSSGLEILGSGLGSLSNEALVQSVGSVLQAYKPAGLRIDAQGLPLQQVESNWLTETRHRIVFTL